ncbi:peptide chain release factor H [Hyphomicrobiales bacterium 4NK60-0047b]
MKAEQIKLLVSSGSGPAECKRAVSLVVKEMLAEARESDLVVSTTFNETSKGEDPSSALITVLGEGSAKFSEQWLGTIKWVCPSPFRPNHKRQSWFVGVFLLKDTDVSSLDIKNSDLKFDCFRAGGPGGQHQNTTDSAVRVTHLPSGISAVCRDGRSQHRNKKLAIERLTDVFFLKSLQRQSNENKQIFQLHKTLERGDPVRCFKGVKFKEIKK